MPPRKRRTYAETEGEFQAKVIDTARLYGWKVVHYRPARTAHGWTTALTGDKGAPDLILAKGGHVLLVELKSATGTLTAEQRDWLKHLGPHGHVWRPGDWGAVLATLRNPNGTNHA